MNALVSFLKARLAERSSRVQLVVLVVMAGTATGLVTIDQGEADVAKVSPLLLALGPLATILIPDKNHAVVQAASQDEAVAAALDAATRAAEDAAGPRATAVAQAVGNVADRLGL